MITMTSLMDGSYLYGTPDKCRAVEDKELANTIFTVHEKIQKVYASNSKDETGQTARKLCAELHSYAITCSQNSLFWQDTVKELIQKVGQEIKNNLESGEFGEAKKLLKEIQSTMYT